MYSHTYSARRLQRLEVVETGRRLRWSEDEKLRIVLESLQGPRLVSATARRHGISRSLLLIWRRAFEASRSMAGAAFVPAVVVPAAETPPEQASRTAASPMVGRMVIVLGRGRRVVVDAGVDAAALARVLDVLERR
ncbi:IS66-like element accessory protein TnpA [Methylobacterium oryzisoli]|uniref:IS66-like element accessory protein TnpA n=1 Tax=Methylobacterium oryzisoli TaxID=3385502 RepID=UPI003891BCDD